MTSLRPFTCSGTCQADATCHRPPRFQAHLDATQHPGDPRVHRYTEACASHLGAMIHAMTVWARDHDLTEGDLTIVTIEPPPRGGGPGQPPALGARQTDGLVFSTIQLGA